MCGTRRTCTHSRRVAILAKAISAFLRESPAQNGYGGARLALSCAQWITGARTGGEPSGAHWDHRAEARDTAGGPGRYTNTGHGTGGEASAGPPGVWGGSGLLGHCWHLASPRRFVFFSLEVAASEFSLPAVSARDFLQPLVLAQSEVPINTPALAIVKESLPQEFTVVEAWGRLLEWPNRKAQDAGRTNTMRAMVAKRRQVERPPCLVCCCSGYDDKRNHKPVCRFVLRAKLTQSSCNACKLFQLLQRPCGTPSGFARNGCSQL